jgi:hypothetical protein
MTKMQQQWKQAETDIIDALIGEHSVESIRMLRVETGMDYIKMKYGIQIARRVWQHKSFWQWWRTIWHLNDLDILDWLTIEAYRDKRNQLHIDDYAESQLAKALQNYVPARELLESWMKAPKQEPQLAE